MAYGEILCVWHAFQRPSILKYGQFFDWESHLTIPQNQSWCVLATHVLSFDRPYMRCVYGMLATRSRHCSRHSRLQQNPSWAGGAVKDSTAARRSEAQLIPMEWIVVR